MTSHCLPRSTGHGKDVFLSPQARDYGRTRRRPGVPRVSPGSTPDLRASRRGANRVVSARILPLVMGFLARARHEGRSRPAARGGSRSSLVTCTCQKTHNEGEDSRRNDAIRAATRRAEVRGRTGTHPWYTGAAARATVVASLRREEDILPVSGRSRQAMARHHELPTAVLARRW